MIKGIKRNIKSDKRSYTKFTQKNNYLLEYNELKGKEKNNLKFSEKKYIDTKTENAFFLKNIINNIYNKKNKENKAKIIKSNTFRQKFIQFYPKKLKKDKLSPYKEEIKKSNQKIFNKKSKHIRNILNKKKNKINFKISNKNCFSNKLFSIKKTNNFFESQNSNRSSKKINVIFRSIEKDYKMLYENINKIINN